MTTRTGIPSFLNHTWIDDGHALVAGSLFVALGLVVFAHAGLLTGGVAGLAFLANYATGASLALCFFVFSVPFFALAWKRLCREFTLKSFGAVALVSACTELAPLAVRLVGALVIGAVLTLNHRPGRYLGV